MKSAAQIFTCTTLLILSACGSSPDGFEAEEGKAENTRASGMLLIKIDEATVEWAERTVSQLDQLPIGAPNADKRFREVYGRLTRRLSDLATPPAVMALDVIFPPHDGEATEYLVESLDSAPFQVVPGSRAGELDPGIYGSDRRQGHTQGIWDLELKEDKPEKGRMGIPLEDYLEVKLPAEDPLSVAGTIEALIQRCDMAPAKAEELARARADQMSEPFASSYGRKYVAFGSWEVKEQVSAIPVVERELVEISAVELLEGTISEENQAKLAGAAVIVGGTWVGYGDIKELLSDGQMLPGVLLHAWTMSALLAEGC